MRKGIFSLIFFTVMYSYVMGQTSITNSYPLKAGNIFFFKRVVSIFPHGSSVKYYKNEIVGDTVLRGRKYFHIKTFPGNVTKFTRLDTLNGILMMYDELNSCPFYNFEKPVDSLWASLNDTASGCGYRASYCEDVSYQNLFGVQVLTKNFHWHQYISNGYYAYSRRYAEGFGEIESGDLSHGGGGTGGSSEVLIGCVIDGTSYGDTAVFIQPEPGSIPSQYYLAQNYPNPFNPVTTIDYVVPGSRYINITLFDALGKKVAVLVDAEQEVGKQSFVFDASGFPSGVYFYRLSSRIRVIDTKRMVLLK